VSERSLKCYEERYCLFLDILGFKFHVNDTVSNADERRADEKFFALKSALGQIRKGVHYRHTVEVEGQTLESSRKATHFSDSVVVSYRIDEPHGWGLRSLILDAHNIHLRMAEKGILVRGGISRGLLFHDDELVFGPAMIQAYELENERARYPRVIIDRALLAREEFRLSPARKPEEWKTVEDMVAEDDDGFFFVNYFLLDEQDFFAPDDMADSAQWYLKKLAGTIRELTASEDQRLKEKGCWLREKFNAQVKPFFESGYSKLGLWEVPEDDRCLFEGIKPL
jgi:hypothetical protein